MIPTQIHLVWVNDDSPPESVRESIASWQATSLPVRVWTKSGLTAFGSCTGPENVQANYYRTKILVENGGFYVDADSFAKPEVGAILRSILPTANIVAAGWRGEWNNAPMGAAPGLHGWDWLAEDPANHYRRWNEYLAKQEHFVALPGDRWNATKDGKDVLVVHKIGSLKKTGRIPSMSRTLNTPAKQYAHSKGWWVQDPNDYHVFALRKSGHHAIMHWWMTEISQTVHHYNDCFVPEPGYVKSGCRKVTEGDLPAITLCNFEDQLLPTLAGTKLLVIRNPFHCFASRIKGSLRYKADWLNVGLWKAHAREFLGETNTLGTSLKIVFDKWHASREYREAWALKHIGHLNADSRLCVPEIGRSMFDDRTFDGRADQMAVLSRAEQMREHPAMKPILADEELHSLWQRIEESEL